MISLKNIKVAIFDFDDTLAIHRDSNYVENRKADEDGYFLKAYENPQAFFETIEPCTANNDMRNLVGYCRNEGIPMFCVTGMRFSLHMSAKNAFIKKYYGDDIELITSAGQERKSDVVRILIRHFNSTSRLDFISTLCKRLKINYSKSRKYFVLIIVLYKHMHLFKRANAIFMRIPRCAYKN